MEKSEFLVSLLVCEKLLSTTLPLSVLLQEKSLDLVSAFQHAKEVLSILKNYRNNEDKIFNEIFKLASRLSEKALETDLKILWLAAKQKNRANPQITSAENYYRVTVFIPCLDSLIQNLTERFTSNEDILSSFQILLPGFASVDNTNELQNLASYFDDRMSLSAVKAEYELWCEKASTLDANLEVLKVLEYCDPV